MKKIFYFLAATLVVSGMMPVGGSRMHLYSYVDERVYELGWEDGYSGKPPKLPHDSDYMEGYDDGEDDWDEDWPNG